MTLKFESEIFVKTFDKDFEAMLSNFGDSISNFGKTTKLEHTFNISNSPVLPDDKIIETLKNNIFEVLTETFEKESSLNAEVKCVEYIGIVKIQQKEN
jgi:hypothetical protein